MELLLLPGQREPLLVSPTSTIPFSSTYSLPYSDPISLLFASFDQGTWRTHPRIPGHATISGMVMWTENEGLYSKIELLPWRKHAY